MKKEVKVIFHIDMNAFFASCHIIEEPYLKNKVFVVGRTAQKGIITTASYKARKYGIKSGMSSADAIKLYPRLLVVPGDYELYKKHSKIFFDFLHQYTSLVLVGSIDEAYLDITELAKTRHPIEIAKEMMKRLVDEHNLPCSIGIAPTLFLAKMASDMKKPLGITVLRKRDVVNKLYPRPIETFFGIGNKTYPKLIKNGIKTIGELVSEDNYEIAVKLLGNSFYTECHKYLKGQSSDVVDPYQYESMKSISNENTFNYLIDSLDEIIIQIEEIYKYSHSRLIKYGYMARTFGFKMKYGDFKVMSKSKSIKEYTADYETGLNIIKDLILEFYNNKPIRLLGVFFNNIIAKKDFVDEYNLFTWQKFIKLDKK